MYTISSGNEYLLVKFIDDFDFPMIKTAIYHETSLKDYADTNDIWLIGNYRAEICLGEIDLMVAEFVCRCPADAERTKTAIVVAEGLTGAVIELWVRGLRTKVPFEVATFRTLEDAECWLSEGKADVA